MEEEEEEHAEHKSSVQGANASGVFAGMSLIQEAQTVNRDDQRTTGVPGDAMTKSEGWNVSKHRVA